MAPYVKHEFTQFYRTSIDAIRGIGFRALVIGAASGVLPDPLPQGVFGLPFAPFSKIYPRCIAVIHHGGSSTIAEGLRAGKPALVVPWGLDQFVNAVQVERIGAGLWMRRGFYNPRRGASALRKLIYGKLYKTHAEAIAAQISNENGVEIFCDAIEDILNSSISRVNDLKT
ncbi:MAG: hypothetical protein M1450_02645 [Patescibacteria group bacterium]|nr:hypothetical protein [Patescibacteria group bacterium]